MSKLKKNDCRLLQKKFNRLKKKFTQIEKKLKGFGKLNINVFYYYWENIELFIGNKSHTFAVYINIAKKITVFEKLKKSWEKAELEYFASFYKTCGLSKVQMYICRSKKTAERKLFMNVISFCELK